MKKTCFAVLSRITSFLLAWLMLLSLFSGLVLPASAASSDKVLPEMSKFFGTDYTQAEMTEYSRLLTCIYDKCEGTAPLEAFLELLQEDRYQLELDSISDEYPDKYSTATVKDYFFHYTGTSSAIKWIKLKDGTKYHVRVSLYTYEEKDYSAIVYYSHPNFLHRDAGICYADIQAQKEKVVVPVPKPKPEPAETTRETEVPAVEGAPDLRGYFGDPLQATRKEGRTEYYYEFPRYPVADVREFVRDLESAGARESYHQDYETGNILDEYSGNNGVAVSMYWYEDGKSLQVILYDEGWAGMTEPVEDLTTLKNRQTVKVQEDAIFGIEEGDKVTLKCTYDLGKKDEFHWEIISGEDVISISASTNKGTIEGENPGKATIEMIYICEDADGETDSRIQVYTIYVE